MSRYIAFAAFALSGCVVSTGERWDCTNLETGKSVIAEPWYNGDTIHHFEYSDENGLSQKISGRNSVNWKCRKIVP
jgi:hypothetical protein